MGLGRNPGISASGGGGSGGAIIVAAADAPDIWKEWAIASGGSVCDHVNDQTEIQAAMSLSGGQMGVVQLSPGFFSMSGPIGDVSGAVELRGVRPGTYLEIDAYSGPVIDFSNGGSSLIDIGVYENNYTSGPTDILVRLQANGQRIEGCYLELYEGTGISVTANTGEILIADSEIYGGNAIQFGSPSMIVRGNKIGATVKGINITNLGYGHSDRANPMWIVDNQINLLGGTGTAGIYGDWPGMRGALIQGNLFGGNSDGDLAGVHLTANGSGVLVQNNRFHNFRYGIHLASAAACVVRGNHVLHSNRDGILLVNADDNLVEGNRVERASSLTDDTYAGIMVDGDSDNNLIVNNQVRRASTGNMPKYGIRVDDATCNANVVTNNDLLNSSKAAGTGAAFSDAGTGTVTTAGNRT